MVNNTLPITDHHSPITIGITGQSGFIGTHLYNRLSIDKSKYKLIPFSDDYFSNDDLLDYFVSNCDCIVHLAALNRHSEADEILRTNIRLVEQLIQATRKYKFKTSYYFFFFNSGRSG